MLLQTHVEPSFFVHMRPEMERLFLHWMRDGDNERVPSLSDMSFGDDPYLHYLVNLMVDETARQYEVEDKMDPERAFEIAHDFVYEWYYDMIEDAHADIIRFLQNAQLFYTFASYEEASEDYQFRFSTHNYPVKEVW